MKSRYALTPRALLHQVAQGSVPRIIDFRGNYENAIPTTIPVQHEPDIFFEQEAWVQDMLGVPFSPTREVLLVCHSGASAEVAIDYFLEKNPKTRFRILALKGGWLGYQTHLDKLLASFRNGPQFKAELTALTTSERRFCHLVKGIYDRVGSSWNPFRRL